MTTLRFTIDPIVEEPIRRAMSNEDHRWFTTGLPRIIEHPADKGGLTCGGITAKAWGAYKGLGRPATRDELRAIGVDEAIQFYYVEYVRKPHFDALPDAMLQSLCIDWCFTSWSDDPWRAVQISLRRRGLYLGPLDGLYGKNTKAAIVRVRDWRAVYVEVWNERNSFYLKLALRAPDVRAFLTEHPKSQLHNLEGWLNRNARYVQ